MVKQLNISFDDKEFDSMKKFKGRVSWKDFIILMFTHCLESVKNGTFEIFKEPLVKKQNA